MRRFLRVFSFVWLCCLLHVIVKAQTIAAGAVSGTINTCFGTASSDPNLQQFTVTGAGLINNITVAAPIDFEISLSKNSGYSTMLTLLKTNGAVNVTVYVRASSSAKLNGIAGRVMLTSSPATPKSADVNGTVNATPYVLGVVNQTKNNGEYTDAIKFTGNGQLYRWTNDNPAIGLPASGTGDIPPFIATNTGSTLIGAHITVTPELSNGCSGIPASFSIAVYGTVPAINVSGFVGSMNTDYGIPSSPSSFIVSGNGLQAGIAVTPPKGFEVSTDNINFSNKLTIGKAGSVGATTIYVRLAGITNAGTYSGNIILGSKSADDATIQIYDSVVVPAQIKIAGFYDKIYGDVVGNFTVYYNTPGFTFDIPGLQNGNAMYSLDFAFSAGFAAGDPVTTYFDAVTISNFTGRNGFISSNYNIAYLPDDLRVLPAPLTIKANSVNKKYGTTLSDVVASTDFTVTGLKNHETIGTVNIHYGVGATDTDPAGLYTESVVISGIGGGTFDPHNYDITYVPANINVLASAQPLITATGVLSAVNTIYGTPSVSRSFQVSGKDLTGPVTITPPVGFEISTDGVNFSKKITTGAAGNVAATTVYVRLAATTNAKTYSGNIILSSAGTADVNVPIPNSVVKPAPLKTIGHMTKYYGNPYSDMTIFDGTPGYTFNFDGLKNGNTFKSIHFSFSAGNDASAPVGVYKNAVLFSDFDGDNGFLSSNYNISYTPFDLNVIPAPLTISTGDVTKPLGSTLTAIPSSTDFTATGLKNGETIGTVNITYGTGSAANAGAGTYNGSVKISGATGGTFDPTNYKITYVPANIKILASAQPVITATGIPSPVNTTYGTPSSSSSFQLSGNDLTGPVTITPPAGFEISTDGINFSNSLTVGGAGNVDNTTIYTRLAGTTNAGTYSGDFVLKSIGAADVKVPIDNSTVNPYPLNVYGRADKFYGDYFADATLYYNTPGFSFPDPGLQNGNTFYSLHFAFTAGNTAISPAGTYSDAVAVSDFQGRDGFLAGNYNIVYNLGDLVVERAPLTIIANPVAKPYGTTLTNVAASTDFTTIGLKNGETIGTVTITYGGGAAATDLAADYPGSVSISDATGGTFNPSNYDILYVPADIIVNGAATAVITATDAPQPVNTIYGTPSSSSSFTVSGTALSTGITVTPPQGFEVSIDNINFGSTVTVGAAGAVNPTTVYIRLAAITDAGPYNGNITLTAAATQANVFMPNSVVSPAPLTIAALTATKTYGDVLTTYTGADKYTITAGSLKNGNTINSVTINYGPGSSAGDPVYTYTGSAQVGTLSGGNGFKETNYTITLSNADIIVSKAPLTVTADNKTKEYGAVNPVLTYTYSGFVNNDTEAQLTTPPTIQTTATISSSAGKYPITFSGGASPNYTFAFVNGVLTITPPIPAILVVPNTFTPNQDGINDTWNLPALAAFPNCTVNIYTRYGQAVFRSVGYPAPWDGTYNGKNVPAGVYYYVIDRKNNTEIVSGSLTVLR